MIVKMGQCAERRLIIRSEFFTAHERMRFPLLAEVEDCIWQKKS